MPCHLPAGGHSCVRLAVVIRSSSCVATIGLLLSVTAPGFAAERRGPVQVGTDVLARDSWIVTLVAGANPGADAPGLANAAGGRAGHVYRHALHGFQFNGSAQAAEALRRNPRVASVTPDIAVYLTDLLPHGVDRVAAWDQAGTDGAYQQGFRGNGARIAILDTGIDLDHPDLVGGIDAGLGTNCINGSLPPNDGHGHGSHVSGTAASPYNGVGMVGIAPEARLVPVKVFDDTGNSAESIILCGLDHIIGLNSDGGPLQRHRRRQHELRRAASLGRLLVRPAARRHLPRAWGRDHPRRWRRQFGGRCRELRAGGLPRGHRRLRHGRLRRRPGGLAGCPFVFEIFWFECDDSFAFFSNYGPVDVIAPGVQEYSTWAGGGYQTSSGTSMATPHITGIAALMAAAAPGISPDAALAALLASGECPNGRGRGRGRHRRLRRPGHLAR